MRKFEVGKRYAVEGVVFEIVARTAKTVTYVMIQHAGRFNESRGDQKKTKVYDWKTREIFFTHTYEVEA